MIFLTSWVSICNSLRVLAFEWFLFQIYSLNLKSGTRKHELLRIKQVCIEPLRMNFSSNVLSSSCKTKVVGEAVGLGSPGCICYLPIKKVWVEPLPNHYHCYHTSSIISATTHYYSPLDYFHCCIYYHQPLLLQQPLPSIVHALNKYLLTNVIVLIQLKSFGTYHYP